MEFLILGPVEVRVDGEARPVAGGMPRATLAVLLLHRNEVVSSDRLIDALWGERAPETVANALQVHVSQVRKVVGERLQTRAPGYVLVVEPDELDLDRFEQLAHRGRSLLADGKAVEAAAAAREALSLWRGPALGGIGATSLASEAARLDDLRLATLEDRIDADLGAGGHGELVGELEGLAAEHPFRERFRLQLMLALYRSGRQAAALEAYRQARETLVDQLGIEPSPALQRLEQSILRHDPELEGPERPAASMIDLPTPPTPLLGRKREVAQLVELLSDPHVRLVTLTGPGGIGKTRLALAAAAEAATALGGAAFVPLGSITDAELVPSTIATALGAVERPGEATLEALVTQLRTRRLLLVLDNFEQLLPAGPMLSDLLAAAPGLTLLVTSRAVLRLAGEHELEVPPLDDSSAVELFAQRARAMKPGFEPDASVAELCARLDCLPLAIELAAARTKLLAPAAMLQRLEHRFELLGGGRRDAPERQQTLRTTIDWSYALLSTEEQRLFARLAIFVGGWTLEAAEAVTGADLDTLALLVDKSLVHESAGRFTMLETIREYALERLAAEDGSAETPKLHAAFFLDLAQAGESELEGPNQLEWVDRLDAERGNLRASFAHLLASGRPTDALALATGLRRFWHIRGHLVEGRGWLETALAEAPAEPGELWSRALNGVGMLSGEQGDVAAAEAAFEASLEIARRLDLPIRMQASLANLGNIAAFRGDYDRARAYGEESLELARAIGGRSQRIAIALENLGSILVVRGDVEGAIALLRESYASAVEWGAPRQRGSAARTLARALLMRGDVDEAAELNAESLALTQQIGEANGAAECLETAGGIAALRGSPSAAARLFGAAEALRESIGARRHPDVDGWYRGAVDDVRGLLGDAFEADYERGRTMMPGDVLALARAAI